jgi:hypothetical protein
MKQQKQSILVLAMILFTILFFLRANVLGGEDYIPHILCFRGLALIELAVAICRVNRPRLFQINLNITAY